MKLLVFVLAVCIGCYSMVHAQFHDFPSEYSFGGGLNAGVGGGRDPRANTGPVVFPPAPPDNGETSGVVVGASGYGFVPPGAQSLRVHQFAYF